MSRRDLSDSDSALPWALPGAAAGAGAPAGAAVILTLTEITILTATPILTAETETTFKAETASMGAAVNGSTTLRIAAARRTETEKRQISSAARRAEIQCKTGKGTLRTTSVIAITV